MLADRLADSACRAGASRRRGSPRRRSSHRVVQRQRGCHAGLTHARTSAAIANLPAEPAFVDYLALAGQPHPAFPPPIAQAGSLRSHMARRKSCCCAGTHPKRVETMRRDFSGRKCVARAAHALTVWGLSSNVRELKLDPSRVRDYLGMIATASRMHRISEDLLTLSVSIPRRSNHGSRSHGVATRPACAEAEALVGRRHSIRWKAGDARPARLGNQLATVRQPGQQMPPLHASCGKWPPLAENDRGASSPSRTPAPHRAGASAAADRALLPRRPQPLARNRRTDWAGHASTRRRAPPGSFDIDSKPGQQPLHGALSATALCHGTIQTESE